MVMAEAVSGQEVETLGSSRTTNKKEDRRSEEDRRFSGISRQTKTMASQSNHKAMSQQPVNTREAGIRLSGNG